MWKVIYRIWQVKGSYDQVRLIVSFEVTLIEAKPAMFDLQN